MSRASVYSFPPTPQDWTQIQDVVRAYYVNQKLPLKEVRTVLRDRHGFRATDRMIKARLKQWGYLKNAKKEDWHFLALLHERRKGRGKPATVFDVRGHRKTVKDLQRFIRNQNMTTDQFLDEARQNTGNKHIPNYIQALTPDSRQYNDSPDDFNSEYVTPSPPPPSRMTHHSNSIGRSHAAQPCRPTTGHRRRSTSASSTEQNLGMQFNSRLPGYQGTSLADSAYMTMSSSSNSSRCTQIQNEFEMLSTQITQPTPLISRVGYEDISSWALLGSSPSNSEKSSRSLQFVCSRCNQPSEQHFISLDTFEPRLAPRRDILNGDNHTLHLPVSTKDEGSWLWVSRCFLACMCLKKGDNAAAEQSLREAASEFERLLGRKDRQLLTAAGLVMTVLHMHDQGAIATKVIESAYEVTKRMLASEHPITTTMKYLTSAASIKQKEWGITSALMYNVWQRFLEFYPDEHEFAIAARYNYAWMLKFEGKMDEAEKEARQVYQLSCQTFGKIHMQSITAMAVIAGCIYSQTERLHECIALFRQVAQHAGSSLGEHHPYTLEAKRRLAIKLRERFGSGAETLQLYREVLWGRAHMLGPDHSYTQGAREDYEQELMRLQLWTDALGNPLISQQEVVELFSPESPGSWTRIRRRRTSSLPYRQQTTKFETAYPQDGDQDELVMVDVKSDGSQSPRSRHEFEAY